MFTFVLDLVAAQGLLNDKSDDVKRAVLNNRRRSQRDKGRRLQRQRSEKVERSFAHLCNSGGTRRCWIRGLAKINKRDSLAAAAHNLSQVMRKLFGLGQPRNLQGMMAAFRALLATLSTILATIRRHRAAPAIPHASNPNRTPRHQPTHWITTHPQILVFSTDC